MSYLWLTTSLCWICDTCLCRCPSQRTSETDITFVAGGDIIGVIDHTKDFRIISAERKVISSSFSQVFKSTVRASYRDPQAEWSVSLAMS